MSEDRRLTPEEAAAARELWKLGVEMIADLEQQVFEGLRDALAASGNLTHAPDGIGEGWRERRALIRDAWEACGFDTSDTPPIVKRYAEMYRHLGNTDAPS